MNNDRCPTDVKYEFHGMDMDIYKDFSPSEEYKMTELEKEFSAKGFANQMRRIARDHNTEMAHILADELMCKLLRELGYGEGVDLFEKMDKWYS